MVGYVVVEISSHVVCTFSVCINIQTMVIFMHY